MQNKLEWLTLGDIKSGPWFWTSLCSKTASCVGGWGAAGACQGESLLVTQSKINLGRSARNLGSSCLWVKVSLPWAQIYCWACHKLGKKGRVSGIRLHDFRWHYKATVIKQIWYWHENRHTDQWNRRGSLETEPSAYSQFIYVIGGKGTWQGKYGLFNRCCWRNWTATCKRIKLDHFLTQKCINCTAWNDKTPRRKHKP